MHYDAMRKHGWYTTLLKYAAEIEQSNFYSANIPGEARLSGATAKLRKQFRNK